MHTVQQTGDLTDAVLGQGGFVPAHCDAGQAVRSKCNHLHAEAEYTADLAYTLAVALSWFVIGTKSFSLHVPRSSILQDVEFSHYGFFVRTRVPRPVAPQAFVSQALLKDAAKLMELLMKVPTTRRRSLLSPARKTSSGVWPATSSPKMNSTINTGKDAWLATDHRRWCFVRARELVKALDTLGVPQPEQEKLRLESGSDDLPSAYRWVPCQQRGFCF